MHYINEDFFNMSLTEDEIYPVLKDKSIIVFGAGDDGEYFIEKFDGKLNIKFFIDNGADRKKIGNYYVYHVDECLKFKESIVVITSTKYFDEMAEQLKKIGLKAKDNFYIFDRLSRKYARDFVEHNKKIWKRDGKFFECKNKILINYYPNSCATYYIIYSYIAN